MIHLRLENGDFSYLGIDDFAQRLAGVDMLLVACPVDSRLFVTQCPPAISSISSTCSVSGCPCGICWACSSAFDLIVSRSQESLSLLPRHGISHLLKILHFLLEMNGSSQMGSGSRCVSFYWRDIASEVTQWTESADGISFEISFVSLTKTRGHSSSRSTPGPWGTFFIFPHSTFVAPFSLKEIFSSSRH